MSIFDEIFNKPQGATPLSGQEEKIMQEKFNQLFPHTPTSKSDAVKEQKIPKTERGMPTDEDMNRMIEEAIKNGIHFLQENNDDIVFSFLIRPDGFPYPHPDMESPAAKALDKALSEEIGHSERFFIHVFSEAVKEAKKLGYRKFEEDVINGQFNIFSGVVKIRRVTLKKTYIIE